MRINHNISALNTTNRLAVNSNATAKNIEKLSSGFRINRAADDAAGLSISEKMRGQIRGLDMAARNSQDGISLIQTAEGALSSVSDMLGRIKELATQASNGTYDSNDLNTIDAERAALSSQITDTMNNTKFNGITLLDGTQTVTLQIGQDAAQTLALTGASFSLASVDTAVAAYDLKTMTTASTTLADVENQINAVSSARAYLGANQNRLEYTINNLNTVSENLTASESRIRDVDMAKEMMDFTKNNILSQAAQAMLAQANQQPQGVLQLLR